MGTIEELWVDELKNVRHSDLAPIVAKGINLDDLDEIGGIKFSQSILLGQLDSLKFPSDFKARSATQKFLEVIFQCYPSLDVIAQSHFAFTITWGVCRLLFQVVQNYYTLSDKAASIVRNVIGYIIIWKDQAFLLECNVEVKRWIRRLFHNLFVLVGFARYWSQQNRVKKMFWFFTKKIERHAEELHNSAGFVEQALHSAARQLQHQHRANVEKYQIEQASALNMIDDKIGRSSGEWFTSQNWYQEPEHSLAFQPFQWFFESSNWKSWVQGSSRPLAVIGPAGSGKTCLALSALSKLRTTSSHPVLSYFFNSGRASEASTGEKFLASILVQVYHNNQSSSREAEFKSFKQRHSRYSTVSDCRFYELFEFVEAVLDTYGPFSLVIDSVDECQTHQQELTELLRRLANTNGIAVITTARHISSMSSCDSELLDLQCYPEEIRTDVSKFVKHQVETRLVELNNPKYADYKSDLIQRVLDRCENNFLHAKLFIELLAQCGSVKQMKETCNDCGFDHAEDFYTKLWKTAAEKLSQKSRKMDRRRCIFQLVIAANEDLLLEQIDGFLALDDDAEDQDPENLSLNITREIEELCSPFISCSASNRVTFFHTSARDFVASQSGLTKADSNLYISRRCLSELRQKKYRCSKMATELLHRHLMPDIDNTLNFNDLSVSSIYNYAALHFQDHITSVRELPKDLVFSLGQFLTGVEFVTWSEIVRDLKPGTSYATQVNLYTSLSKWAQSLDQDDQQDIKLEEYFETAHILLSLILKDNEHKVEQFLPRIRLGDYFNSAARDTGALWKGYEQKKIVVEGLSQNLHAESIFLLRQKVALLQEYFWQKRFPEALNELQIVLEVQRRVAADDDLNITTWLIGLALVTLGKYNEAEMVISDTLKQIRRRQGIESRFFNVVLLLEGARLELINGLDQAATSYSNALKEVSEVAGTENLFVWILKTALGSVLRKQKKYEDAEKLLLEGWAGRQLTLSINLNTCVDAALHLAIMHRDKGDKGDKRECLAILNSVQDSTVFEEDFERYCQLIHIRNLVALDDGDYINAKREFLKLLRSADGEFRNKNNRTLLWIRLDLYDAMRQNGEFDEGLELFTDLVEKIDATDMYEELKPLSQLELAEKALRLIREARFAESQRLLDENNLRWVRDADFWFSYQGGPTLDTAVIAPVKTRPP